MKLGTKGRYAVMAMVDLAYHGKGNPVPLHDISLRQGLPLPYLEQLFAVLKRHGLVFSARGVGGGYTLSRPAHDICIADLVLAVGENLKTTRCASLITEGCLKDKSRCLTHDLWEGLGNHIQGFLKSVSLEDVCKKRVPGLSPHQGMKNA